MIKFTKIQNGVYLVHKSSLLKDYYFIVDGYKTNLLYSTNKVDLLTHDIAFDSNYVIIYSKNVINGSATILSAYNFKSKTFVDLGNQEIMKALKYMFLVKRPFVHCYVLSAINDCDLGLVDEKDKYVLLNFLSLNNPRFSKEFLRNHILKKYPELKPYANLDHKLTTEEYMDIIEKFDDTDCWFNVVNQNLDDLPFREKIDYSKQKKNSEKSLTMNPQSRR